jgi:hypothetical protein
MALIACNWMQMFTMVDISCESCNFRDGNTGYGMKAFAGAFWLDGFESMAMH